MLQGKTGPRVALKYEGKSLTPWAPLVPRVAHDNRPHPVPAPHPILALGTRGWIIPGAGSHSPSRSRKDFHADNLDGQSESIPRRRRTHRHMVELQLAAGLHWLSATDMLPPLHWLSLRGSVEQEVSTQAKAGPLRKATGNAPKGLFKVGLTKGPQQSGMAGCHSFFQALVESEKAKAQAGPLDL